MAEPNTEQIYLQFREKVTGFVRSKVNCRDDAEDLVQTVFLKVCANIGRYDEKKASLSTWIYTITRNTVYDYLKEKRDRPQVELREDTAVSDEEVDASLLTGETLEELAAALERLPSDERDAVMLLYYKGLDRKTVAEMLGMTYGQVRYLHDKALKRLGELLHIN